MPKNNLIHYIITGGTIDSYYDGTKDTAVPNDKSVIPRFIESLKLYSEAKFTEVCMKDSRSLTSKDLDKILKTVQTSKAKKFIVTHGTYTMPDTARFLKKRLKIKDQIVVITGSMIPINGFSPSDGPFSLGYAIAQLQYLKPGVYVCMNGKVFLPEEIVKILAEGRFASIFKS